MTFPLYIFGAAQRGIPVQVNVSRRCSSRSPCSRWSSRLAAAARGTDGGVRPEQEELIPMPSAAPVT